MKSCTEAAPVNLIEASTLTHRVGMLVAIDTCFDTLGHGLDCRLGRRCLRKSGLLLLGFGGGVLVFPIISCIFFRNPLHHICKMGVN
jgi:hypothetical protein